MGRGEVQALMKGSLHTDELMGAVVSANGLRTARRISHCFVMDVPDVSGLLIVTDAAINIAPDLKDKADIVQNAIDLARVLGIEVPKGGDPGGRGDRQSRHAGDARCGRAVQDGGPRADHRRHPRRSAGLRQRDRRGGGRTKGIDSPVAGQADILLVPDLEAATCWPSSCSSWPTPTPGIVLGARVPIVLTSRADSVRPGSPPAP
jgi:phosphate acetyltransferase